MPDIAFWNKCDNKCVMCTNPAGFSDRASVLYGLKAQIGKMERYLLGLGPVYLKNADKADFVSLTGGEPTLHPDFFRLLAYFRRRLPGVNIALLSNGRRFSDKKFAARFARAAAPPFLLAVPLHAASAVLHDRVAGVKGAFAETLAGLENLLALGLLPEIRIVLHRLNVGDLRNLLALLLERFPAADSMRVAVIHYEIEGMSQKNHGKLALRLAASSAALSAAFPLIKRFGGLRLYHFPLCVVDAKLRDRCLVTLPPEDRIYTGKCAGCRARAGCLGLMAEYHKKFGDGELRPLKRAGLKRRK